MQDPNCCSESCGMQLINLDEPSIRWGIDRDLGAFAKALHRQIVDAETYLAVAYWRLGQTLHFRQEEFQSRAMGSVSDDMEDRQDTRKSSPGNLSNI